MSASPRGRTREVALVGIVAALSFVLGMIGPTAPNGGRIGLSDVPVLILGLVDGWGAAVAAGAVAGLLHFVQQPVGLHPIALVMDFPLASSCLGLCGLLAPRGAGRARVAGAITVAVAIKLSVHVLSGVLFWLPQQAGWEAWIVSLQYNAAYMVPRLVIDLAVIVPLADRLQRVRARG